MMTRQLAVGTGIILVIALGVALWLSVFSGKPVERLSAEDTIRQACDAVSVGNFDAVVVITDDVHRIVRTYTVSGSDSRVLFEGYTIDGNVFVGKLEDVYKDGVWYSRSNVSDDAPNTWGPWEVLELDAEAAIPGTPCLAAETSPTESRSSDSSERHFTWQEPGYYGTTTNMNEVWVSPSGLPTRGVITETESIASDVAGGASDSASPRVLQRTEITYSGFGETNTITAPIPYTPPPVPSFASAEYSFSVAENSAVGTAVGTVSASGGTGTLTYSLPFGNQEGNFAIDSSTGAITVATANLDFETKALYWTDAVVTDADGETGRVAVDINITDMPDNAPAFGSATYAFSVAEDAAVGAAVGTVSATGLQGDSITYSITAGNGDGKFAIGSGTGAITVAGSLDHETTASYTLTVEASDGTGEDANKTTVQATITVTDVDEPPVFAESSYSFSVSEDTSAFTIIGAVKATDPDAGDSVTHHLTAGDTSWWNIDLNEGFILVRKSLDYETKSSHTLTIEARDSGGSNRTSVTVDITITDVDER